MRFLVLGLLRICRLSLKHPRAVIAAFVALSIAGFCAVPFITVSSDLMSGVGHKNPGIRLTIENTSIFGEQDSLILVLEFPEPPGETRLPFIRDLSDSISQLPGVLRVRYQFMDPEDHEQAAQLLQRFLLGMNASERKEIHKIFSVQGITDALRRTRNRLFLTENAYLQERLLEDPLEVGQFVARSMETRVGSLNLGDPYLLIASPDSTLYLIQITPKFPSTQVGLGKQLIDLLNKVIPDKISQLTKTIPGIPEHSRDIKWYLTGKTAFQYESDMIFDRETATLILCSFALVVGLLLFVYRSFWSAAVLMTPLAAGIGASYGVIFLSYSEVNPVVMGATGILLGLGAEYGEHLWGRIREEIDRGRSRTEALEKSYAETGPPVVLGGLTGILAFLCLCLSDQPALKQFGYFGAAGLALTLGSTLFLVPAIFTIVASRKRDHFPGVQVPFTAISGLFRKRPKAIVAVSAVVIIVSMVLASRVTYEKDLFKVFLASDMQSMAVSDRISRKFHSNFSQPILLSFDVDNIQEGLAAQRALDDVLEKLIDRDHQISSFDSISYLMSPDLVRKANTKSLSGVVHSWPTLRATFERRLKLSDFSQTAAATMERSFEGMGTILKNLERTDSGSYDEVPALEKSWYLAKVSGKYRFLTRIRLSDKIRDPDELAAADQAILNAVSRLPVTVSISGPRQAMEAMLATLVSELVTLGLYAFILVVAVFFVIFPNPLGVALCLIPMIGGFSITLGAIGLTNMGVPFSIVCVAPLIFGFGIHNGIHVVMGSLHEKGGSVERTVKRVTPRSMVTSLTITMGFVSMLTSQHYSLTFLGRTMVIGMMASVPLTLITLPALLLLIERWRARRLTNSSDPQSRSAA
jgi:uncharacterized protein